MKKILFIIALLLLALKTGVFAADDPFTGTWREIRNTGDSKPSPLRLSPVEGGISIQGENGRQYGGKYGQNFVFQDGYTLNIVRVDDHTLKSTISPDGKKIMINETATVSPDGKRYVRIRQSVDGTSKETLGYDRVGPIPSGDAFFGTWQLVRRDPLPKGTEPLVFKFKVEGEAFDWFIGDTYSLTAKFDAKEYKDSRGGIAQLKRNDDHAIEVVTKTPASNFLVSERKELLQVKGNRLTVTRTRTSRQSPGTQLPPHVIEFERVK